MPKRIPVTVAKRLAEENDCRQIILLGWDGKLTHIVTYGVSAEDCSQAAAGGNMLKAKWGWPECNDQPSRVKKLEREVAYLKVENDRLMTSNGAMRRKLDEIALQYAADCL